DLIEARVHGTGFELLRQRLLEDFSRFIKAIKTDEGYGQICISARCFRIEAKRFASFSNCLVERSYQSISVGEKVERRPVARIGALPNLQRFICLVPLAGNAAVVTP